LTNQHPGNRPISIFPHRQRQVSTQFFPANPISTYNTHSTNWVLRVKPTEHLCVLLPASLLLRYVFVCRVVRSHEWLSRLIRVLIDAPTASLVMVVIEWTGIGLVTDFTPYVFI
jgi:hypothetical protein